MHGVDAIDKLESGESPPCHSRCATILLWYEFDILVVMFVM